MDTSKSLEKFGKETKLLDKIVINSVDILDLKRRIEKLEDIVKNLPEQMDTKI